LHPPPLSEHARTEELGRPRQHEQRSDDCQKIAKNLKKILGAQAAQKLEDAKSMHEYASKTKF
jgi:nucleotidyltransferase/DNA polymerase involved in DNA repair